jgi:hypothetical protein
MTADRQASLRILTIGLALLGFLPLRTDGLPPERLRTMNV